ncbi:MAG: hypothetical protein M3Z57_09370 [Candidatus Dormibacteraeota bacterium]|nr:hypothetical protein [Candidatus Dormibacteraeota bacterium]
MTTNDPYAGRTEPVPPPRTVEPAPAPVEPRAPAPVEAPPARSSGAVVARDEVPDRDVRQRRELNRFRGFNLGAALFGWLVVIGIAALLTAILGATGAAIALTNGSPTNGPLTNGALTNGTIANNTLALTTAGAVLLLVVLAVAYFAGGYVAGRLSRFAGGIQGVGVWVIGLLVTVGLAIGGAVAGAKYNVLDQLRLPSIPVNGQSFASGAAIAVAIIAVVTLVAAVLGGTVGLRYHHRVDRALERNA